MKKIVTSCAALLIAGLVGGCTSKQQASAPAAPADSRTLYQGIVGNVWGTAEQRVAADKAVNDRFQTAIADCMAAAGQPFVKGSAPRPSSVDRAPADLDALAELGKETFGIAARVRYDAEIADADAVDPTSATLTEAQRDAQAAALGECGTKVGAPADVAPADQQKLAKELVTVFTAVQAQPAVKAALSGYGSCMATKAGIKVENYAAAYEAVYQKFTNGTAPGWAALSKDPKWAEAVAFEKKVAAADTACRKPVQDQATAAAAPQLAEFTTKHAKELAAADAAWAKLAS